LFPFQDSAETNYGQWLFLNLLYLSALRSQRNGGERMLTIEEAFFSVKKLILKMYLEVKPQAAS